MKTRIFPLIVLAAAALLPLPAAAQETRISTGQEAFEQNERPTDPYLPNAWNNQRTTPGYRFNGRLKTGHGNSTITTIQVNVTNAGENIMGDAANEPSIAVDPRNPNRMMIGWRQFDNVASNFRQAGWAYTTTGGEKWINRTVIEPGIFRSDPVLDCDTDGNFYYNSLTYRDNYYCQVFRSPDGKSGWDEGVEAAGGDKQWMIIDKTTGTGSGNIYSFWSYNLSSCAPGFFTRSTDGGDHYEACSAVNGRPKWGTMAVGMDGELYIAGKSTSSGRLVVAKSISARYPDTTVTWANPKYVDVDGNLPSIGGASVNPEGLLGQVSIAVDPSDGPGHGYLYVLSSITPSSSSDPCDIIFSRSINGGLTWTPPVRVNDDDSQTNVQWFGTMSVAPNGRIDAIWLDTRDAPAGSDSSALYYSYSLDQGSTWSANERLSPLFDPTVGYPNQNKMGDYFDMVSDSTGARLAWANTLNGEQDVYYSYITPPAATGIDRPSAISRVSVYPNPSNGWVTVGGLPENTPIGIYSILGEKVKETLSSGTECRIDLSDLPAGIYVIRARRDDGQPFIGRIMLKRGYRPR